ncbi:UNVERIFIED_ORG: hypothetical protein M2312_004025 [Rhizobium esperanzae]|nr:hypothetical protein [Rhizobium esperanzae]
MHENKGLRRIASIKFDTTRFTLQTTGFQAKKHEGDDCDSAVAPRFSLGCWLRRNQSGRSVPSSPCGTKRAVGIMVSGGSVSFGLRENIMRCSLALEMKKG